MADEKKDIRKLEELVKETVTRVVDMWDSGEGDLIVEIRDEGGNKKAKLKGGPTKRIT